MNTSSSDYEYQVGASLRLNSPTYVTRQADEDLYQGLRSGEFCYVLTSRQMGKSSLRVRTMARLQAEDIVSAAIQMTDIIEDDMPPDQLYAGVINSIVMDLGLSTRFDDEGWWINNERLSAVNRFSKFIDEVLLELITQQIVIFIDEVDRVLSLPFSVNGFFAVIRECYNKRADDARYTRLTFALIGVATPSGLIQDKNSTPFNIGRRIDLTGIQPSEANPLLPGLATKAENPEAVLHEVLAWTGGQPFLTQKLCQLVRNTPTQIPLGEEITSVEALVRSHILENWEFQDEPVHLRTIRDRLLNHEDQHITRLLDLYQQVLEASFPTATSQALPTGIAADRSAEQMEILLTGLVTEQAGKLQVFNRIYASIFDQSWIQRNLNALCPYAEPLKIWTASGFQDKSRLLRGEALQEAEDWAKNKELSPTHYRFFDASKEAEREIERKETQILSRAYQRAKIITAVAVLGLVGSFIGALYQLKVAKLAKQRAELIGQTTVAMSLFREGQEIKALKQAMMTGQQLQKEFPTGKTSDYPTDLPLSTLQTILDNIQEQSQFNPRQSFIGATPVSLNWPQKKLISWEGNGLISHIKIRNFSGQVPKEWKTRLSIIEAISPDGEHAITQRGSSDTLGNDGSVQIESSSGQKITINNPESASSQASRWLFSPDGQRVAVAYIEGKVKLYQISGEKLAEFTTPTELHSIDFSPNGQMIATTDDNSRTLRVWDLSGQELATFKPEKQIVDFSFSADGQRIALSETDSNNNNIVQVYEVRSQKQISTFDTGEGLVSDISFSPDGKTLVTSSGIGTIKLWDSRTGENLEELTSASSFSEVSFSPDGNQLASTQSSGNGSVQFWTLSKTERRLVSFRGHFNRTIANFSPDGKQLFTAGNEGTVKLWNLTTAQQADQFDQLPKTSYYHLSFDNDGQHFVVVDGDTVSMWDFQSKKKLAEFNDPKASSVIAFSPDHQQIAILGTDSIVRVWDRDSQKKLFQFQSFARVSLANSVTFSPDGKYIVVGGLDGNVAFYSPTGLFPGSLQGKFLAHPGSVVSAIAFSPDGRQIVTGGVDGKIKLWSISEKLIQEFGKDETAHQERTMREFSKDESAHTGQVTWVNFSPNGQQIATAGQDGKVKLWDLSGQKIAENDVQNSFMTVSFSPDGKQLAIGTGMGTVKLWTPSPFNLDNLLTQGCQQLHDYLILNPEDLMDLEVCQKDQDLVKQAATNLVSDAMTTAQTGNVEEAIVLFRTAQTWNSSLKFSPEVEAQKFAGIGKAERLVIDATMLVAHSLSNKEKNNKELVLLNEAVKLDPDNVQAFIQRGLTYDSLNKYNEALQDFKRALELDPNNADALNKRANTYLHMKLHNEALNDVNQAIALDPKDHKNFTTRGSIYLNQKRYNQALQDYTQAYQLNPKDGTILQSRAIVYDALKRDNEALQDYNRAIELEANSLSLIRAALLQSRSIFYFQR